MIEISKDILAFLGTNEYVLGIASIAGIAGFILTILVTIRTNSISKILKYNQITAQYNKDRADYQKAFDGHRTSILEDNIRTNKLLKDILSQVESYRNKFQEILPFKEQVTLFLFQRLLQKDVNNVDWNKICNYLAILSGRLTKKEDFKNG